MLNYVLYGFGILLCISGMVYLATEYVRYVSEWGRLACLILSIGMFVLLGRYFEEIGW